MAEAHAAVAFQFTVTSDGLRLHVSQEAFEAVYQSGLRSWRKRFTRFINRFHSGVYPASFYSLFYVLLIVNVTTWVGFDTTFEYRDFVERWLPFEAGGLLSNLLATSLLTTLVWLLCVLAMRYLLKFLLCYHGWMFEAHRKTSIVTKIWGMLIKLTCGDSRLYSYQASLPHMPVPSIKGTVARYMKSVRPLCNDAEYEKIVELANEFKATIASQLQRYIVLKSWWSSNYVSDWWEQYVYLAGRDPIMVNSNYYGMDLLYLQPTHIQVSRAATLSHAMLQFRSTLDKELVQPIKIAGMVPLCSWQYERIFNTTRIPGLEIDQLIHLQDSRHIAVLHKGRWFKVTAYKNGILLTPKEFEEVYEAIVNDMSEPSPGEENLAAFTAGNRKEWAEARVKYFSDKINKDSLRTIETSAFVLVLDDEVHTIEGEESDALSSYGRGLLHGNCNNRWFDKSMTVVIYGNGRFGVNAEHSWADAPVVSHCAEEILYQEFFNLGYDEEGRCNGHYTKKPLPPKRLQWNLSRACIQEERRFMTNAHKLADDVDLRIFSFKHFGKGLVKTFKMSPDAFIQISLQLANYRDKGHFCLTYEASMTRLYREGRTETVRSCTNESSAFVLAMESPDTNTEERLALLKVAAQKHVDTYKEAMTGKGIDRHLFCLYIMSKYLKLESPFLQKVLSEPWRLSTSQTSMNQTLKFNSANETEKGIRSHPLGGGFGPVADDGYGVSYIICHENMIMFHISSKKSSPETDSTRFAGNIEKAMLDIRDMFANAPNGTQ